MMRFFLSSLAIWIGANCASAQAGMLLEADLSGSVQQSFDAGEVSSCGVVVAAVESPKGPPNGKYVIFNGSFSVWGLMGGLVKGRAAEIDAKRFASGKSGLDDVRPLRTTYIWMKAPDAPVTRPVGKVPLQSSDDAGYLIYGSELQSMLGLVDAVLAKRPIQVGVTAKEGKIDLALFGVVSMSDAQSEQLRQCMAEWSTAIRKKYKDGETTSEQGASKPQ